MTDVPIARIESDLPVQSMSWDGGTIVLTAEGHAPLDVSTPAQRLRHFTDGVQEVTVNLPAMNIRSHSGIRLKITVEVIAEVADGE